MSFFKSSRKASFINPSEYTINSKGGSCTYIKDDVVKSKPLLSELCALVCPQIAPNKENLKTIVQAAKSILDTTSKHADKFYAHAMKTADPEEFFNDISTVKSDYARMQEIEKYVYYGASPSNIDLYNLDQRLQIEIRHLIDRAYAHSQTLKNPTNAVQKQFTVFQDYLSIMDEQSIKKLNSKYKKFI